MKGAICGTLTALGMAICIVACELPVIPHDMAWRIVGWIMICGGVWPMAHMVLKEADR